MTPKWKIAFVNTLQCLENDAYVREGAAHVSVALTNFKRTPFIEAQIEAVARSGDEAAVKLILSGRLPLGRGRSAVIDPAWSLEGLDDRNDRWLIQQWFFIRDCVFQWRREQDFSALLELWPSLLRWTDVNLAQGALSRPDELSWHDHTTALRALNLISLGALLHASPLADERHLAVLFKLIEVHTAVLRADDFYTVGTNHGFDQAYALYFLACAFPLSPTQREARMVARERLVFELSQAFNEEGVHIENSPGYHTSMLGRLPKAKELLDAFDGPGQVHIAGTAERAIDFLTHALKPNGSLPLLGDTEALPLRLELETLKQFSAASMLRYAYTNGKEGTLPQALSAVYPKAGYAFLRDRWPTPSDAGSLHLTFKCGFLSSYHRHDDDNTILLFAFGEDWLIGSGIYKYHEQDDLRKYVRSAQAQNVVDIVDVVADRNVTNARSAITDVTTAGMVTTIKGVSRMYPGFNYERTLTYDRAISQITLVDVIEPVDELAHDYVLRFHIPRDKKVEVLSPARVQITSQQSERWLLLQVQTETLDNVDVASGQLTPPLGWTSPQRGIVEPAQTVSFKARATRRFEITSTLSFPVNRDAMSCMICNQEIERRVAVGGTQWTDRALPVLIDGELADARCSACGSRARHRALAALLSRSAPFLRKTANVLLIGASKPERRICGKYFDRWRHVSLMGTHDDPECEVGVDITKFESATKLDYIVAWVIFDYIPDTEAAFQALARSLAPGGLLIFYIMPYRLTRDVETVEVVHRNALKYESYAPGGDTTGIPHCRFNPDALLRWLGEAGLTPALVQIQDESSPMLLDVFVARKDT
jgi:SAM-dependent methyltransferase